MRRDTILFDINETVLDLSSLRPKFQTAFGDDSAVAAWFAMLLQSSTVCALTDVRTTFAALAGAMLDAIAGRRGLVLSADQRADILGGFASLNAHADIVPALQQLRARGYRTVAFSNSSLALVTRQIDTAGLDDHFDQIVSVEETGSFKPAAKVYRFVAERVERAPETLRLVAAHDWDTHGAVCAGLLAAYIDRSGAPYHPLYKRPDIFATTMGDVVAQIVAADAVG